MEDVDRRKDLAWSELPDVCVVASCRLGVSITGEFGRAPLTFPGSGQGLQASLEKKSLRVNPNPQRKKRKSFPTSVMRTQPWRAFINPFVAHLQGELHEAELQKGSCKFFSELL
jgi:hypothetical protein